MSLKQTATKFNNLLIVARIDALEQVKQIYHAAQKLFNTKDLWLSAVEYEPIVESPLNQISDLAKKYYWNAQKYGISASNSARYLTQLQENVGDLSSAKLIKPLDPNATNILTQFKNILNQTIPLNISPPEIKKPTTNIPDEFNPESSSFYLRS